MDEMFKRGIIIDRSLTFFKEGVQSIERHDLRRAADKLKQAANESPKFLTAYNNLGAVLLDLGEPKEALEVLQNGRAICLTLDLADNIDKAEAMLANQRRQGSI